MISLNKILVPTDFSKHSEKAIRYGVELAKQFSAELHLLHAFEIVPIAYGEGGFVPIDTSAEIAESAKKHLDSLVIESAEDLVITREITRGHPFVEIVQYAKQNEMDLIVLGTHGRGAIAHMLLGSVAEKVVQKAFCPVLVVRDEEHDFIMP